MLGVATAAGVWLALANSARIPAVVRIGINNSPPYAIIHPDGSYSGFTIEVLNEAARRKGMVLQWIIAPEGPDIAIRTGKIDVWHLLTDLPERHKWAYFTEPWLRTQFVLAVPKNGAIRKLVDAAGRRISHTDVALQSRHAGNFFPESQLIPEPAGTELNAVCRGEADAAFIDMKHMLPRLLQRSSDCGTFPLDVIPVEHANFRMAIGATRSGFGAARELRAEITRMDQDQTLDSLYRKWLRDTTDETRIVSEMSDMRERSRLFRYAAAGFAALAVLLVILIYRERTVRNTVKSALEFATTALDAAGGLVFISDRHGRILRFNRACENVTGKTLEEVRNQVSWDVFVPPEERDQVQNLFAGLSGGLSHATDEHHWMTRDGARLFSWSNTVLLNEAGRVEHIIATGIDISHREAAERQLGYEATHDPLTNLVNRRGILREVESAFEAATTSDTEFSVAIGDLDRFKVINDAYGHEAGDDVLCFLAHVMLTELGPTDLAGRLGGDEFCIILRGADTRNPLERIRTCVCEHEFRAATGETFRTSVTFGIATWCRGFQQTADLLRAADRSLYECKAHAYPHRQQAVSRQQPGTLGLIVH